MTEPEGTAPLFKPKVSHKRLSPLELFQEKHCRYCEHKCNPTEQRFLVCVLAALLETIYRANALNQNRFAHY